MNYLLKNITSGILFLNLFLIFSCNESNDIPKNGNPQIKNSYESLPEIEKIRFQEYYSRVDQRVHKYATYLPSRNTEPLPLIIYLHGAGDVNREFTYGGPLKEVAEFDKKYDFIIAAPHNNYNGWHPGVVHEFLELIKTKYNIDTKRIYVTGMSMGAFGTFSYAITYPNDMTAIVPLAGGISGRYLDKTCNLKNIPAWIFHSIDDNRVSYQNAVNAVDAINNCNPTVAPVLTTYDNGYDHSISEITYRGVEGHDIYSWMLEQVK